MCWLNAAETHETFHWESGMRYQVSSSKADMRKLRGFAAPYGSELTITFE